MEDLFLLYYFCFILDIVLYVCSVGNLMFVDWDLEFLVFKKFFFVIWNLCYVSCLLLIFWFIGFKFKCLYELERELWLVRVYVLC